jgi:hypothetical protein
VHYGSCSLVDLLLDRGELAAADAVLSQAEALLADSADLRNLTRLRARRSRLLRITPRAEEAAAMLKETEKGIDPEELTREHLIWLVEQALTAGSPVDRCAWTERLDALSERTGVQVPPWERRWLDRDGVRRRARVCADVQVLILELHISAHAPSGQQQAATRGCSASVAQHVPSPATAESCASVRPSRSGRASALTV